MPSSPAADAPRGASPNAQPTDQPNTITDHEVTIAADEAADPETDGETQSISSSTASVTSSIFDYRVENGRTYHRYKDGKYHMPNDEREQDRLDLQHNMFVQTFDGKLGTAPPNQPGAKVGRVLDVGTGTGIWCMDFGDEHPEAEVRGIDLSAVQPEFTPPNVKFEIDDLEDTWIYSHPFEYIHSRMMNSSISDWKEYIQKCYDNLTPGGYLELNEVDILCLSDDGSLTPEHSISKTARLLQEATENLGRRYQDIRDLKPILMEVGFEDVVMQRFKWPTNDWPKDPRYKVLGQWTNENLRGWEAICMAPLTRGLDWTREEVIVLMSENRRDFNDRSIHAYFSIWSIYGRKPLKTRETESQA
ncbi:Secondary metabolism regulator LAE1 [Colletotrichum aenigma]|uniref:Secondary metabolism regulator LAE1 n=1 Tax=Colletotrichum aenigma TaxID=1215731 RepID=UPI0018724905|nr:Secondary metabolism regulator LAE1 [Colletotrichum aenigma]KAF5522274.1 Secondary metabolism regulator LAE1 [Colletotrichum aenigma]